MPAWLKPAVRIGCALVLAAFLFLGGVLGALAYQPQWLVPLLESGLGWVLDRTVEIGELSAVDLGRDVSIVVRDVRIGNPAWAQIPDLLKAGRVGLRMDLTSLWRDGPVIVQELELVDLQMTLLAPDDQPPNWRFGSAEGAEASKIARDEEGDLRLPLVIREGRLENAALLFRDPDQEVHLQLEHMDILDPGLGELIEVRLAGALNGIAISGRGEVGPGPALLTGRNLALNVDLQWGDATLQGSGHIGTLASLADPELGFLLATPHARPLLDALGMPEIRDGALRLEGQVTPAANGLSYRVDGTLDEFSVQLSGSAGNPMSLDDLVLNLAVQGPSLREAGAVFDLGELPEVPFALRSTLLRSGSVLEIREGEVRAGGSQLAFDGRLPDFPEIGDWDLSVTGRDLDLSLLGPALGRADLPSQLFQLSGRLRTAEAGTEVLELQLTGPQARVAVNGLVGEAPGYRGSRFQLEASGENLSAGGAWLGMDPLPAEPFQISGEISLTAQGWQLSEGRFSAGTLSLELAGSVDSSEVPTDLRAEFSAATPDLAQTLQTLGVSGDLLGRFPLVVRGRVEGPPRALRLLEASIESGETRGRMAGELGDLAQIAGLALSLEVAGPDLASFLPAEGPGARTPLPFSVTGNIARTSAGWEARQLEGRISRAQIGVDGRLSAAAGFADSSIKFSASGDDLAEVLAPWTARRVPAEPFVAGLTLNYESGRLRIPEVSVRVGELELGGRADLGTAPDFAGTEGLLRISGPSTQALLRLLDLDLDVPDSAVAVSLRLSAAGEALRLDDIQVSLGESDLSGGISFRLGQAGDVPEVHADFRSSTLYLPFLIPNLEEREADTHRSAQPAPSAEGGGRVIPDAPLDFGWMRSLNGSIRYRVDQMLVREGVSSRTDAHITLRDGVLTAPGFSWDGSFSTGEADVRIRAMEQGAEIDVYLESRRIPLIWLLAGEPDALADRTYRLRLNARGNSVRSLAESAEGALVYNGGGGRISNYGMSLILGDVLNEVFSRLNPWAQAEPYTQVVCSAGAMTVEHGVVSVIPGLVFRTDKLDVAAAGTLDLRDERLDLSFSTRSRKGIGISAAKAVTPYLKIGGTLAQPRLVLDSRGAAVSGGAAVATAGLSIIAGGLWDRWVATASDPCERLFTRASEDARAEFKSLLARPEFSAVVESTSP